MDGSKHKQLIRTALIAAGGLGAVSAASAQVAQTTAQQPINPARIPYGREPATSVDPTTRPINIDATQDVGTLYQSNGGSLMRAILAAPAKANQATLAQMSYLSQPVPEPKTVRKHDLITVVISEVSTFTSTETAALQRALDINAELDAWTRLNLGNLSISAAKINSGGGAGTVPQITAKASRDFTGSGNVDRSDSLTARITGEIVDVKPNGTLVIQARKRIGTDEEEQEFILTGTCRAEDVNSDNTVLSTQLYDLQVQKNHKGTVREATRRTWLQKLVDVVSPF